MLGVGDRRDGGVVAHTARPPGDLSDVEDGVPALHRLGIVAGFGHRVVRPQDQVGHTDIQPAVQPGVPAPHGVEPADGHREATQRLPLQVVVELAGKVAVQGGAVAALGRFPHDAELAQPGQRPQRRRGGRGPQDRRAVQIEERAVEHQAADAQGGRQVPLPQSIEPQRHDQPARGVPRHAHLRAVGLGGDDRQGALEFPVVAGQVGGEVRGLAGPPGSTAFVQVQRVIGESAGREPIGGLGVEEVVGVAVHTEDRVPGPPGRPTADQGRDEVALAVGIGAEFQRVLVVAGQDVGLPYRHAFTLAARAVCQIT